MKQSQVALAHRTAANQTLYMALDLGRRYWHLALGDGSKERRLKLASWDQSALVEELGKAKHKLGLPAQAGVRSVQEAGRDGFSVHRLLQQLGVESLVVDSSSIEVNRRARQHKTDRLDAGKLLRMLLRYAGGERKVWSVVHVPSEQQEEARRVHREIERLTKERTAHRNRLRSLLATQGICLSRLSRRFAEILPKLRTWRGEPLPGMLQAELGREQERLDLVERQLTQLRASQAAAAKQAVPTPAERRTRQLHTWRGIGRTSAWTLSHEFFWRRFRNRREVGSAAGLAPSPYSSGEKAVEQGISKAGNARVRALLIQLSWRWLQHQPTSELSRWYRERFGAGGGRARRIGIVALARKLLVAMWRYLETGVIPAGVVLKAA